MLSIEKVFNNCGILEVRFCQDDISVKMVHKVRKQVKGDGEYYAEFFSDGTVQYGCYIRGKWWSSNAEAINEKLNLCGTEWELQEGCFGVNSHSCGILKRTFEDMDKRFKIQEQFSHAVGLTSAMFA